MFKDRIDAGTRLAEGLLTYTERQDPIVVLAIPRGGLPLGAIVSETLNAPLHVVLSKKIGHPVNKEYAIGAVSLQNRVLGDVKGVSEKYLSKETARIRKELAERAEEYLKEGSLPVLKDKTVIIVDDGIATGNTIRVTAQLIALESPKKVIVAVPVAPASAIRNLENSEDIDEVFCLKTPFYFQSVGQFYKNFSTVTDKEALRILEEAKLKLNP